MDTETMLFGGNFLVHAIYSHIKSRSKEGVNRVAERLLGQISLEEIAGCLKVCARGQDYARMRVHPFSIRLYELPEAASINHPQIQRIMRDVNYLHSEGFYVIDHREIRSKNLYYVLTNEEDIFVPENEKTF